MDTQVDTCCVFARLPLLLLLAGLSMVAAAAHADIGHLPLRVFDADDGLPSWHVRRIVTDSKCFLWFCTPNGLTRFDGARFVSFGRERGLDDTDVYDVVEDREGSYWLGTGQGIYRFHGEVPSIAERMFERIPLPMDVSALRLLVDRRNRLWVGTSAGVVVIERDLARLSARRVIPSRGERWGEGRFPALLEDPEGAIWAGSKSFGLWRIGPDGRSLDNFSPSTRGLSFIRDLLLGPDGRIWCTFFGGVARLGGGTGLARGRVDEILDFEDGLPSEDTRALLAGRSGEILVATTAGVAEIRRDGSGHWRVERRLTTRDGLPSDNVEAIAMDPAGNLWLTTSRGAMRIPREGLRHYPEVEEPGSLLLTLLEENDGVMLALALVAQRGYRLHRVTSSMHEAFGISLPSGISYLGWGGQGRLVRDGCGDWWLATGQGLLRYRDPARRGALRLRSPPDDRFGEESGLRGGDIFKLFVDSRGDVW